MMSDDAPGMDAPAMLAASISNAQLAVRPTLYAGLEPRAAVVLVEIEHRQQS
jgi:hypothetical protein